MSFPKEADCVRGGDSGRQVLQRSNPRLSRLSAETRPPRDEATPQVSRPRSLGRRGVGTSRRHCRARPPQGHSRALKRTDKKTCLLVSGSLSTLWDLPGLIYRPAGMTRLKRYIKLDRTMLGTYFSLEEGAKVRRSRLGNQSKGLWQRRSHMVLVAPRLLFGSGYLIGRYFCRRYSTAGGPGTGKRSVPTVRSELSHDGPDQTKPVTLYPESRSGAFSTSERRKRRSSSHRERCGRSSHVTLNPSIRYTAESTARSMRRINWPRPPNRNWQGSVVAETQPSMWQPPKSLQVFHDNRAENASRAIQSAFVKADTAVQPLLAFWDAQYLGKRKPGCYLIRSDLSAPKSGSEGSMTVDEKPENGPFRSSKDMSRNSRWRLQGAKRQPEGDSSKVALGTSTFAFDLYHSVFQEPSIP